ncbi:unnamed protein product [Mytilus coruscus]|uniref:Reverse transcriptase domain-containing protein n=1 Tax=Mytilus coruscus TaxID=42192 RepID=A0A6J8EDL9_MYTCO|nr:unnamed protein product [Mytilus coruscus]
MEEFKSESKDLNKPTIYGILDAKSAFDVLRHTNLIRKLYYLGISEQCILMIDNLYRDATSKIKWKGNTYDAFNIEQGVRQGETLSADLCKVYVNQLLNNFVEFKLGGKIGSISCCAPTCADDIAIVENKPFDVQVLINMAYDYSQREGYLLQPEKSVILPVKTNNKVTFADDTWSMKNKPTPFVTKTSHIGIQRDTTDSAGSTIEENLKKARRSLYSLMHTGLHGENGLDPVSAISMLQTFIFPIMFYGLEILLPTGKNIELISKQYKRIIKQILSLPVNVADPAIYLKSGLLPAEAVIHTKGLILFGSICRAGCTSTEWKIAERQLGIKCIKSNSWFIAVKAVFLEYEIGDPYMYLFDYMSKMQWKNLLKQKVSNYWSNRIKQEITLFTSLKYIGEIYTIGKCYPIARTLSVNIRDISRIPVRLKILTGTYIFQAKRAVFNKTTPDGTCLMCKKNEETMNHFLLICEELECIRKPLILEIIIISSMLFAKHKVDAAFDISTIIVNPYFYCTRLNSEALISDIDTELEPLCRSLCYKLHA